MRQQQNEADNKPLTLTFFNSDQQIDSLTETGLDRAFKTKQKATQLLDYRLRSDRQERDMGSNVEDEDVQRLCTFISGGYVEEDFGRYLSYNEFQQRLAQFDTMRNIYQDVQRKYRNRKIEESQIKFRSLLLMVYLEQNLSKLTKTKLDELFHKHRLVE